MIGGDAKYPSVAAASVLAKTARDAYCIEADAQYPQYGFAQHKGYGTKAGLRQGMGCPLPDYDLLAYYFELGGRKLTIGSDAHFLRDVGASIPEVCEKLRGMGFTTLSTFEGGRETLLTL